MMAQTLQMTEINPKIENISKNIGEIIFKLGTSNVQIRHKVTPIKMLPRKKTLLFPVPLCYEPNILDFEQISTGRWSDLQRMCCP